MFHSRITQEFAQAVASAESLKDLSDIVEALTRDIGFRYFALTHHVDLPRAPQPAIRLHNYPAEWASWFDAERLGPSDPVHRASHLTQVGFRWSMLPHLIHLTPRDQFILERARLAGLGDGFTVPAHVAGESAGSCSFATRGGASLRADWIPVFQYLGAVAFDGARRLSGVRMLAADRPRMTDRQRDCLFWAARGKSDWEISQILGIGHDTASQHVKQARGRYGVCKRAQLTVHALYEGAVTFTDLLQR